MGIPPQERKRPTAANFWLFAATAAISWSVVTMATLHVVSSHDPVFDTLSSYAYTDRGTGIGIAQRTALAVDVALLGRMLMLVRSRVRGGAVGSLVNA